MNNLKSFVKTSLLGGLIVLLPVGLLLAIFLWIVGLIKSLIHPLTNVVLAQTNVQEFAAVLLALGIIVLTCFAIGVIIKTRLGRFIHEELENRILKIAPGYNLIKETVLQFLGNRPSPFSQVALVRIFASETSAGPHASCLSLHVSSNRLLTRFRARRSWLRTASTDRSSLKAMSFSGRSS